MNVDHLPEDVTVRSLGRRMLCKKCETVGADVRPNWQEKQPGGVQCLWSRFQPRSAGNCGIRFGPIAAAPPPLLGQKPPLALEKDWGLKARHAGPDCDRLCTKQHEG
jgi:hypothetical protein